MNPIKKRGCVVPIIIFCIVLAGIFFLFQVTGENSSNTTGYELASTIRLMKIEGEVLVQNAVGNTISSNEQMKLYNGYQIITSNGSYAWLTLDDTKVVKIDANSVVGVQKKNEKITLYIDSGNLFFNVKQPLKEKESFHVKTSTMTMGIRGTSGVVTALENGKSEIRLFTGKVHVYVEEAVNAQRTTQFLVSGNILECTASDQEKKAKTKMITMREEDIPSFAAAEIVEDNLLRDKIQEETNLNVSSLTLEDSSSREQIEEDSTKENQEKSKESVVKEESQSQVTVMTDESKAGNGTIEETMPNHSFYDSSTSSDSSYKETAVNKNTQNESNKESNKNTESYRKEEANQEQKDSQQSKEETSTSSEKQPEKGSTSTSENQQEEDIPSTSESRPEEETTVTPESQPEEGTTSVLEKQPEEGTTSVSEQSPTEEGSTSLPNKQPSEEGTTSSTSSENDTTENVTEENTSSTIEESTEEITSPPNTSTEHMEEDSSDETPENSNRPSWWEEIWGEIWDTIKDKFFPKDEA